MLNFWNVINCVFVHWTKKLTLIHRIYHGKREWILRFLLTIILFILILRFTLVRNSREIEKETEFVQRWALGSLRSSSFFSFFCFLPNVTINPLLHWFGDKYEFFSLETANIFSLLSLHSLHSTREAGKLINSTLCLCTRIWIGYSAVHQVLPHC